MRFCQHLSKVVSSLNLEHRRPVAEALDLCDGEAGLFRQELQSQTWEYPDLPVEEIVQQIVVDH